MEKRLDRPPVACYNKDTYAGSFFCACAEGTSRRRDRSAAKGGNRPISDKQYRWGSMRRPGSRYPKGAQIYIGGAVMRVRVTLACTECKQRNYNTMKNKKNDPDRLEMNKYCRFCRKHTVHRETK